MPGLMCLCVFSVILNLHVFNCVHVCSTHVHSSLSVPMEAREQLARVGSFLLLCGLSRSKSGH